MKSYHRFLVPGTTLAILLDVAFEAGAADTTEPFDLGPSDFEFYIGADGVNAPKKRETTLYSSLVLGYGLLDRVSSHLAVIQEADAYLSNGSTTLCTGLFGTPVDTRHFDLDLYFEISSSAPDFTRIQVYPAMELTLDLSPEMRSVGVYLRSALPFYGLEESTTDAAPKMEYSIGFHNETTLGAYVTVAERHQILLEFDMAFRPRPLDGERSVEVGGAALGYNALVHDCVELITQFSLDIPQQGEVISPGFLMGLIATLPSRPG